MKLPGTSHFMLLDSDETMDFLTFYYWAQKSVRLANLSTHNISWKGKQPLTLSLK